jgi:hypothetical protein
MMRTLSSTFAIRETTTTPLSLFLIKKPTDIIAWVDLGDLLYNTASIWLKYFFSWEKSDLLCIYACFFPIVYGQ